MSQRLVRILFFEDDSTDIECWLSAVRQAGITVTADVVRSLDEFRARLRAGSYDVVAGSRAHSACEARLREVEEQLCQAQKMEAVGRLAGGIAHDFNNLLTVIGGYSQMLLDGLDRKSPMRRDIEAIFDASNRASSLTRQLLAFSRRQIVQPRLVDLNRLIGRMHKMLRRVIGEDIQLKLVPRRSLHRVKADPSQLEQVIMNIAVNARDAMPGGGMLLIETENVDLPAADAAPHAVPYPHLPPGRYAMLAIKDSGLGMDEGIRAHIFEPFFTTKDSGMGTGLGLSTALGIIKQSGGDITVESEPQCGANFRIYLPAFEAVEKPHETPATVEQLGSGSETILLVEDERELRKLAADMLGRRGYRVLEAASGSEALRIWRENGDTIDLLLTDVVMPHMSGKELAEQLKSARPELKVLFMSGYTTDVVTRHGIRDHETAFLQKPFTPDILGSRIRKLLDSAS